MFTFAKVDFTRALLRNVATNNDTKTTILGLLGGAVLADQTLDFARLFHGDGAELGKLAGILIGVLITYYINKPGKPKP